MMDSEECLASERMALAIGDRLASPAQLTPQQLLVAGMALLGVEDESVKLLGTILNVNLVDPLVFNDVTREDVTAHGDLYNNDYYISYTRGKNQPVRLDGNFSSETLRSIANYMDRLV